MYVEEAGDGGTRKQMRRGNANGRARRKKHACGSSPDDIALLHPLVSPSPSSMCSSCARRNKRYASAAAIAIGKAMGICSICCLFANSHILNNRSIVYRVHVFCVIICTQIGDVIPDSSHRKRGAEMIGLIRQMELVIARGI